MVRACAVLHNLAGDGADPVETQKALREADAGKAALAAVQAEVYGWLTSRCHRKNLEGAQAEFTASDLAGGATAPDLGSAKAGGAPDLRYPELFDLLRNVAPDRMDKRKINAMAIGRWLGRNAGTIADGMRFVKARTDHQQAVWRIEKV